MAAVGRPASWRCIDGGRCFLTPYALAYPRKGLQGAAQVDAGTGRARELAVQER
jgi:hypothetical protein